jgi:hypothetical protein
MKMLICDDKSGDQQRIQGVDLVNVLRSCEDAAGNDCEAELFDGTNGGVPIRGVQAFAAQVKGLIEESGIDVLVMDFMWRENDPSGDTNQDFGLRVLEELVRPIGGYFSELLRKHILVCIWSRYSDDKEDRIRKLGIENLKILPRYNCTPLEFAQELRLKPRMLA